ncbi:DsbA family protein [Lichenibacterium dinghuense]|uniref:DsbA family protein n=1 Tax=Lichenibacterium dinghuense TaxID=2895977 RepID=UPI001F488CFC|nr:DsbA family protein [Lichenibacterium sp. 6Y81]
MSGPVLPRRRALLALAAVAALAGAAPAASAADQTVPLGQLMAEPPLPDLWQGSKDAPVTMIEYASMTCTHCAAFHAETWPTLKAKYIDTGKVRFVLREFPLDPLATAGFMLGRCAGPDKRNAITDLLFDQQKNWAFVDKPVEALENTVKQAGITHDAFESCLKDQALYNKVNAERDAAGKDFHVDATPTFFINGVKHPGELSVQELDKILEPLLKS